MVIFYHKTIVPGEKCHFVSFVFSSYRRPLLLVFDWSIVIFITGLFCITKIPYQTGLKFKHQAWCDTMDNENHILTYDQPSVTNSDRQAPSIQGSVLPFRLIYITRFKEIKKRQNETTIPYLPRYAQCKHCVTMNMHLRTQAHTHTHTLRAMY